MQGGRQSGSRQKNRKPGNGWYHVADVTDFEGGKQTKSVIMGGNKQVKAYIRWLVCRTAVQKFHLGP